ncbi:putative uncharacterized protein DDB_G0271606 isoform X2 [Pectinophora gossypiella]|uniref:putative uncharacterized protein DDB_G0271606 isoform X2 n=1 Tax=Pectinophora gossypiella TaxID=13191 RepID=UPI00214F16D6|nr:putative uncharacterized protein DDB_G0271606 isoform X2 [Pectinophora gossypiella]
MADSFFGFDTSLSNLNDDEGGGEPSEDEYDALNDETFGQDSEAPDWEVQHEQLAEQLESSRPRHQQLDHAAHLEASLSQLVLDERDSVHSRALGSSVWRHSELPFTLAPTPVPTLKNVCTVEELERQLRHKQQQQAFNQQQNFYQPRFPPVILQRPPGLQAPVPLPFAPQQSMPHNMTQMNQSLNKIIGQSTQLGQSNMMQNQMGQNVNQMGQNVNQMGQNVNQFMQNANHMGNFQNSMGQNNMMNMSQNMQVHQMNQMGQNVNQMGQNVNQMGQNVNQMGQNVNQMGQNVNQMGQNVNQMGQNVNQMVPNGNQFNPGMNQFPHMMGQPRMMAPPPGMNMPRQNFNQTVGQYNPTFRGPNLQPKPDQQQLNQQNIVLNQQMLQKNQSTQINQKPISQPNPIQSPQSKNQKVQQRAQPEQKMQKSRVYNNSKNLAAQNLTSQNLVQLIQNTHPMLQFNSSFHNASHHPMLNNRSNVFNNNQFVNSNIYNNQRHNGMYSNNNRHAMNGDDGSICSDTDEYAGLMTQREKQWLLNIQMLQLSSGTPYIHDFYYTVFLERQASKEKEGVKEAHKANQQNHPFYSGVKQESHPRERHNSARHNSSSEDAQATRAYAPQQFENSLGKLQCGSVTAPRKIIDVELVANEPSPGRASRAPSVASTTNPAEIPREMRRTKQLLLDIEALYLILLRLEELNDPLAISNALILKEREEKQKQLEQAQKEALEKEQEEDSNVFLRNIESVQRRPKQDSPKSDAIDKRQVVNLAVSQKPPVKNLLDEDKDELINKMFAGLLHGDRIQQMLTVRKGRTLLSRFLQRTAAGHPLLRGVWSRVLPALTAAARRDPAGLAPLAPHYRKYIQNTTGWSAILESCSLLAEAFDPARTPHALTSPLTLSCVCALVEKAALLVNTPEATSNERQWSKFLKTLARALKNTTLTVARPTAPLPEAKLMHHIKQLESRSTIEILQRGKTATEFADITKTDVSEQLIKHLC